MSTKVDKVLKKRFDSAKSLREDWHVQWQELSDYLLPGRCAFTTNRQPGQKPPVKLYDSTGPQALQKAASGLHSRASNPSMKWFFLNTPTPALDENGETEIWFEKVRSTMHAKMARSLAAPMYQAYLDGLAFGTAVTYIEEDPIFGVTAQTFSLDQIYILENSKNRVDTVFRKFCMTARQIEAEFPKAFNDGQMSDKLRNALKNEPEKKFDLVHAVYPRKNRDPDKIDYLNMPYASVYFEEDGGNILHEHGYPEMPYAVLRLDVLAGEMYGRSPGMTALPDVKTTNEMMRLLLDAAHMKIRPPMDVPDENYITPFALTPAAINLNQGGNGLKATPIHVTDDINFSFQLLEERRASIREAFFNDQLQLVGGPAMTAFEVQKRAEMQMMLMGPWQARLEVEYFEPIIHRVFGILARGGFFPPIPESLIERDPMSGKVIGGGDYYISYDSPLARAQRQLDVQAIDQVIQSLAMGAQAQLPVADNFDIDKMFRMRARDVGLPPELMKSPDDVAAARQQQAQQAQQVQMMNQMNQGADMLNKIGNTPGGDQLTTDAATTISDLMQGRQLAQQQV